MKGHDKQAHHGRRAYVYLPEWIYLTQFNDIFVVLNLIEDKYIILEEKYSIVLRLLLNNSLLINQAGQYQFEKKLSAMPQNFEQALSELLQAQIIKITTEDSICRKLGNISSKISHGASSIDWSIPAASLNQKSRLKNIIVALWVLVNVNIILKFKGLFQLIKHLRKIAPPAAICDLQALNNLAVALNKACLIYPKKIKCLEWSCCLVSLALRNNIRCNLVIGVQLPPFVAHAWVVAHDCVIADNNRLPEELAIILTEPFPS